MVLTNEIPFRWSSLESTNYVEYVANLRRVGCPEPMLGDLIHSELETLYGTDSSPTPSPDFWMRGEARRHVQLQNSRQQRNKDSEKRALYRHLMGVEWPSRELRDIEEIALAHLLLDFIPRDQVEQVAGVASRLEKASRQLREEADYLPLPEDDARQLALYTEWLAEIGPLLGPAGWEEGLLRIGVFQCAMHADWLKELNLTGTELREVVRLLHEGTDPMFNVFAGDADLPSEYRQQVEPYKDPERIGRLSRLLGSRLQESLARSEDPLYDPIRGFVRQRDLPLEVGWRLYESRRLAQETVRELATIPDLTEEERHARIQEVVSAAQTAARSVLAPEIAQDYLKEQQSWEQQLLEAQP